MENLNLEEQEKQLVEKLQLVRDDYVRMKDLETISIRKDELIVELKTILQDNNNYSNLNSALNLYINKLEKELNFKK